MVSLCSLPSQINVWHELVHLLTFPQRFRSWTRPCASPSPNTARENVHVGLLCDPPTAVAASGLLLINTQPQCQHWGWGGYYSGLPCGPYPAPVILLPWGGEELGIGDCNTTERQVHLQHLWTYWSLRKFAIFAIILLIKDGTAIIYICFSGAAQKATT